MDMIAMLAGLDERRVPGPLRPVQLPAVEYRYSGNASLYGLGEPVFSPRFLPGAAAQAKPNASVASTSRDSARAAEGIRAFISDSIDRQMEWQSIADAKRKWDMAVAAVSAAPKYGLGKMDLEKKEREAKNDYYAKVVEKMVLLLRRFAEYDGGGVWYVHNPSKMGTHYNRFTRFVTFPYLIDPVKMVSQSMAVLAPNAINDAINQRNKQVDTAQAFNSDELKIFDVLSPSDKLAFFVAATVGSGLTHLATELNADRIQRMAPAAYRRFVTANSSNAAVVESLVGNMLADVYGVSSKKTATSSSGASQRAAYTPSLYDGADRPSSATKPAAPAVEKPRADVFQPSAGGSGVTEAALRRQAEERARVAADRARKDAAAKSERDAAAAATDAARRAANDKRAAEEAARAAEKRALEERTAAAEAAAEAARRAAADAAAKSAQAVADMQAQIAAAQAAAAAAAQAARADQQSGGGGGGSFQPAATVNETGDIVVSDGGAQLAPVAPAAPSSQTGLVVGLVAAAAVIGGVWWYRSRRPAAP